MTMQFISAQHDYERTSDYMKEYLKTLKPSVEAKAEVNSRLQAQKEWHAQQGKPLSTHEEREYIRLQFAEWGFDVRF